MDHGSELILVDKKYAFVLISKSSNTSPATYERKRVKVGYPVELLSPNQPPSLPVIIAS